MESSSSESTPVRGPEAGCGRPDLCARLSAGDELSGAFAEEIAAHAGSCPACSVRLSLIQQAERWLSDRGSSNQGGVRGSTPCPAAEELYDYGRGPGTRGLAIAVERRVAAHLVDCEDCRSLVATLAVRPPAPLLDRAAAQARTEAPVPLPPRPTPPEASAPNRREPRRWFQYAAAAALLLAAFYGWQALRDSRGADRGELAQADIDYPEWPLLRGDSASALQFPTGRVLAEPAALGEIEGPDLPDPAAPARPAAASPSGTWQPLEFVIAPQANAQSYSVVVSRAPRSAFGEGERIEELESAVPTFLGSSEALRTLAPGDYAWEAWAKVNGLPVYLGKRDFRIVDEPAAGIEITRCSALAAPKRASGILAWLVRNKFETDAHTYAGGLPQSPERDAFLAGYPGR